MDHLDGQTPAPRHAGRRNALLLTGLLSVFGLTACSNVVGTNMKADGPVACSGSLGSYHLPRTVLHATIKAEIDANGVKTGTRSVSVSAEPRMGRTPHCLDFLSSVSAADDIRVIRSSSATGTGNKGVTDTGNKGVTDTGFLQVVTNKTTDMSGVILRTVVRTIFTAISGNAGFAPVTGRKFIAEKQGKLEQTLLDIEFDPLDPVDMARANLSLLPHGLCISLGSYTFDEKASTVDAYCNKPQDAPSPTLAVMTRKHKSFSAKHKGILYRPKLDYRLLILKKRDPGGTAPWQVVHSERIALENLSPVYSIGVKRAMFSQRRTALIFDNGELTNFCTTKGSEALEALAIPLEVVRSIIALPAQIIQVKINESKGQADLAAATQRTVELQNELIKHEIDPDHQFSTQTVSNTTVSSLASATGASFSAPSSPVITNGSVFLKDLCSASDTRSQGKGL